MCKDLKFSLFFLESQVDNQDHDDVNGVDVNVGPEQRLLGLELALGQQGELSDDDDDQEWDLELDGLVEELNGS